VVALAEYDEIISEVERCEADKRRLAAQSAAIEQQARGREASLRFALGELRFERDQASGTSERLATCAEITDQIDVLGARLVQVLDTRDRELGEVMEREVELAAEQAVKEEELARLCESLDAVVMSVASRYPADSWVASLVDRLDRARELVEIIRGADDRD
jgi:hypothetical protein